MQVIIASGFCTCLFWIECLGTLFDFVWGSWRANSVGTGSCSHLLSKYHACQAGLEYNTPIVLPRLRIQGKKGSEVSALSSSTAIVCGGTTSFIAQFFSQADRFQRRVKPKAPHTSYKCAPIIVADVCCQLLQENSRDFELPLSEYFFDLQSLGNKAVTVD